MKTLTKAEEQVMQVLWDIGKGFVKEVVEKMPEPKPAYNTVSTVIRILEKKGYIGYQAFGKSHQYHPLVTRDAYSRQAIRKMVRNYFGGSYGNLVSFFVKEKEVSLDEMEDLLKMIRQENKKE